VAKAATQNGVKKMDNKKCIECQSEMHVEHFYNLKMVCQNIKCVHFGVWKLYDNGKVIEE